jgi:hypothetical protein
VAEPYYGGRPLATAPGPSIIARGRSAVVRLMTVKSDREVTDSGQLEPVRPASKLDGVIGIQFVLGARLNLAFQKPTSLE